MVYCYDFNWNDENGTATVINSSRFMFGKSTCLQRLDNNQNGNWKVQDLYMSYDIPIDIDENSRQVTLRTGKLLTTHMPDNTTRYDVYAMPEKWLTTLDDGDDYADESVWIKANPNLDVSMKRDDLRDKLRKAKEALGDLAKTEEDIMSWICFPAQAEKFLKERKEKEERRVKYSIVAE